MEVYTLTGNVIKNGQGDTDIYARLWRDGVKVEDIDTPADDRKYTYRWTKYTARELGGDDLKRQGHCQGAQGDAHRSRGERQDHRTLPRGAYGGFHRRA